MHRALELYLRDGQPLDLSTPEGEAAMAGLHLLPSPGPTLLIEVSWRYTLDGYDFAGIADVMAPRDSRAADRVWLGPVVLDHKNTADFKWAKTPESLRDDIQANMYAYAAMQQYAADVVDLRWVYYRRNKPFRAMPVDIALSRADVQPVLARTVDLAARMTAVIKSGLPALSLPPCTSHCGAYGGCPYQSVCTDLTPERSIASLMSNNEPSAAAFFAHLDAQKALAAGNAPPPPPPAAPWQVSADGAWKFNPGTNAWEPNAPPAPPPPPVPQAAPPVPINPPPVPATVVYSAPPLAVAPPAPEAPKRPRGRPRKERPAGAPAIEPWREAAADACDDLADALRGIL